MRSLTWSIGFSVACAIEPRSYATCLVGKRVTSACGDSARAEHIDNVIIEPLKALRSDLQTMRGEMHVEFKDMKLRLSSVDSAIVSMKHELADTRGDYVRQQVSIDSLVERIQRIEKRLELS